MAAWPYNTPGWQRLRLAKLSAEPLCEYCPPTERAPASHVDHRKAIKQGGDPWAWSNLASACGPCHGQKTRQIDYGKHKHLPIKGCDARGTPLDPRHWWNE